MAQMAQGPDIRAGQLGCELEVQMKTTRILFMIAVIAIPSYAVFAQNPTGAVNHTRQRFATKGEPAVAVENGKSTQPTSKDSHTKVAKSVAKLTPNDSDGARR